MRKSSPSGTARNTPTPSAWARSCTACRNCSAPRFRRPRSWPTRAAIPPSAILALAPLLKAGLIETGDIIVDSKSGVSGGGRTPKLTSHYPECNESVSAYNIGRHRHTPEIDQVLSTAAGKPVEVIFTPQLVPMDRGILTTAYSRPAGPISEEKLMQTLDEFYADEPFVRVVDHLPGTKDCADDQLLRHHGAAGPRPRDDDQLHR